MGSTLYLFGQLRSFSSVSDRYRVSNPMRSSPWLSLRSPSGQRVRNQLRTGVNFVQHWPIVTRVAYDRGSPPVWGTDRSCWRSPYTCVVCPRHVRAPTGGRCRRKPDRGNVYVRWRPRSCAPKKGAIIRRSLKVISVYISVTEPVEPLGSTLYLFSQLRSFSLVSDRYT